MLYVAKYLTSVHKIWNGETNILFKGDVISVDTLDEQIVTTRGIAFPCYYNGQLRQVYTRQFQECFELHDIQLSRDEAIEILKETNGLAWFTDDKGEVNSPDYVLIGAAYNILNKQSMELVK
jgi:hypothetical protein